MSRKRRGKKNNRTQQSQLRRPPAPPSDETTSRAPQKSALGARLRICAEVVTVATLLFAVYSCGVQKGHLNTKLDAVERERDQLKAREDGWKFSEPLYRKIPGDVDFVARKMRVDKKQGARLTVTGPKKGDEYTIIISNLTPRGTDSEGNQQYAVQFTVQGAIGPNYTKGGVSDPIIMSPNTLASPIQAVDYAFFIFVDKVDIDYVYLTVARRPAVFKDMEGIKFSGVQAPFGAFEMVGETPEPIMTASPDNP